MLFFATFLTLSVRHGIFPRSAGIELVQRWRPTVLDDNLLSLDGASRYIRGRIELEDKNSSSILQSGEHFFNMFVLHAETDDSYIIRACLWSTGSLLPEGSRVDCFSKLIAFANSINMSITCAHDVPDVGAFISLF